MTVIALTKGVLASDTKAVTEEGHTIRCTKLFKLANKSVLGCAGDADAREIITILGKASIMKPPSKTRLANTKTEFRGIWAFNDKDVFKITIEHSTEKGWQAEVLPILDNVVAVGSGSAYALGAMSAGKTAIEAVKIACKHDNNCGLPVEHIVLEKKTHLE